MGLRTTNGETVNLFTYFGEGEFVTDTPLPDWVFCMEKLEAQTTFVDQSGASCSLADLLSKIIGVPVGPPAATF